MIWFLLLLSFVKCKAKNLDELPAETLVENIDRYYETVGLDKSCLKKLPYSNAASVHKQKILLNELPMLSPIETAMENFERARLDTKTEFCNLTFGTVLQSLKVINETCQKYKLPDPLFNEAVFSVYYGTQQVLRKHSKWFSCKNQKGQELLGQIIKPEAYQPNYNISNGIFTHSLPTIPDSFILV